MKTNTKITLKYYLQHAWKHKWLAILTYVSIIAASIFGMIVPLYYKSFFDILAKSTITDLSNSLFSILYIIAGLLFLQWILWRFATFLAPRFLAETMADLSNTCFAYLHKHSFSFFNDNFVGSLVKRVNYFTRAFDVVFDRITWAFMPLLVDITMILFVLSKRSVKLAFILFGWMILYMIINTVLAKIKMKYNLEKTKTESAATGLLADTITNNSNVKLLNGYQREKKSFYTMTEKIKRLRIFTWNLDSTFEAIQTFLMVILEIGVNYYAIILWQKNILTPGDFILIQSYLITLFLRIWDFGRFVRHIYENLADAEEMTEILIAPYEIADLPSAANLKISFSNIEFKKVQFNYHKTRSVLKNFNLSIKPREKIALVGPSGAGKSTIVKLLLRQHEVTAGEILIDDQSLTHVTQESLWKNISLVPQDPILFHRTLKENIRYGRPGATDKEVIDAAKKAHCHEFIKDFPEGYETFVGERGVKLSGGERQRVAIARAILRDAPILILDEATSSLDSESESLIQDALKILMKGKTVIVVAHRLSTIMNMDRILVINGGKIVEEGSHADLVANKTGLYQRLWQIQAGGFIS